MKKTALVLAALIALPAAAFAGEAAKTGTSPAPAACITTTKTHLDCAATGSIDKPRPVADNTATAGKKLGVDINPWSITNGF